MIEPRARVRRPAEHGEGFADAVTVSWADDATRLVRHGPPRPRRRPARRSALAVLFRGREPVAALAQGGLDVPADADWTALSSSGGLRTTVDAPLERWTVAWDGPDQGFDARARGGQRPRRARCCDPVARLGGMEGYEQLVRVRGTVCDRRRDAPRSTARPARPLLGRRGLVELELVRTVARGSASSKAGSSSPRCAPRVRGGTTRRRCGRRSWSTARRSRVGDPRLSTTYDGDGHQRRAGLELWLTEEDGYPHRAAGEVICGSSLDLGRAAARHGVHALARRGRERRRALRRPAQGLVGHGTAGTARQLSQPRRSHT